MLLTAPRKGAGQKHSGVFDVIVHVGIFNIGFATLPVVQSFMFRNEGPLVGGQVSVFAEGCDVSITTFRIRVSDMPVVPNDVGQASQLPTNKGSYSSAD